MVLWSTQVAPSAHCSDATLHSDLSVSIFSSGFYQEPFGQRQPVQSQGLCHTLGWWRNPSVYLLRSTSISDHTYIDLQSSSPRWRLIDTLVTVTYLDCHRITTEQNLSIQEGDLEGSSESLRPMASTECHPGYSHARPGRPLDHFMDTT